MLFVMTENTADATGRTPPVTVRLPQFVIDALDEAAAAAGCTRTDIMRFRLTNGIRKAKRRPGARATTEGVKDEIVDVIDWDGSPAAIDALTSLGHRLQPHIERGRRWLPESGDWEIEVISPLAHFTDEAHERWQNAVMQRERFEARPGDVIRHYLVHKWVHLAPGDRLISRRDSEGHLRLLGAGQGTNGFEEWFDENFELVEDIDVVVE